MIAEFPGQEITEQAVCSSTEVDAEVFFPVSEDDELTIAAARRVCGGCPVRQQCAEFAVRTGEPEGIWGGLLPSERRALRQPRPTETAPELPAEVAA